MNKIIKSHQWSLEAKLEVETDILLEKSEPTQHFASLKILQTQNAQSNFHCHDLAKVIDEDEEDHREKFELITELKL